MCRWVEDDGRDHARLPLRFEQRFELLACPLGVVPGPTHRDEGRVPAPLVRIESLRRPRVAARPVRIEYFAGGYKESVGGSQRRGELRAAGTARGMGGRLVLRHGPSITRWSLLGMRRWAWSNRSHDTRSLVRMRPSRS